MLFRGEPDWLRDRRQTAFETYTRLPMPSKTDEEWRRSDVSKLDASAYFEFEHATAHMTYATDMPHGVIVESLPVAAKEHRELVEPRLFSLLKPERDRFTALHAALFTGGNFVYVPDGTVIEEPIRAESYSKQSGTAVLPHTLIVAGSNTRFNYLDEYVAEDDAESGYRTGSTEIFLGEGAQVGYVAVQKWGRNVWHFADQRAELQKDSSLKLFNVTLGGKFSKTRVEASLAGEGSNAELKAIYFASGEQFFDFQPQPRAFGQGQSDVDPDARDRQQRRALHPRRHSRPGRPRAHVLPPLARHPRGDRQADAHTGILRRRPRAHPVRARAEARRVRAGVAHWLATASRRPKSCRSRP